MNDFLKDYHIINNLPFGFDFYNQDLRQLRAHEKWFFENKEQRLTELQNAYHAFCGKNLDYTPKSLKGLGDFFLHAVDIEKKSPEEYAAQRAKFPPDIPIKNYTLTIRSLSVIVDVGIYLGEVMIRNHKNMCWEQNKSRNKRDVERGYMVITINHNAFLSYMNPIWVTTTMGWKVAGNTFSSDGLYELYNYYRNEVSPEFLPD